MIVSYRHRFVFIHVPKTAGESVAEALAARLPRSDLVVGRNGLGHVATAIHHWRHGVGKHASAAEARTFLGAETWDSFHTFSVVRDPVDRVASLYRYVAAMHQKRQGISLRNLAFRLPLLRRDDPRDWPVMKAFVATSGFSEFIRHPDFARDASARPQVSYLADASGRLLVREVLRFDRLDSDFAALVARVGLGDARLGWRNASRAARESEVPVDPSDAAYLRERYAADCAAFGFDRA